MGVSVICVTCICGAFALASTASSSPGNQACARSRAPVPAASRYKAGALNQAGWMAFRHRTRINRPPGFGCSITSSPEGARSPRRHRTILSRTFAIASTRLLISAASARARCKAERVAPGFTIARRSCFQRQMMRRVLARSSALTSA